MVVLPVSQPRFLIPLSFADKLEHVPLEGLVAIVEDAGGTRAENALKMHRSRPLLRLPSG
jgi:hypothetical protein